MEGNFCNVYLITEDGIVDIEPKETGYIHAFFGERTK
jgi:hypothetical protein